MLRKQKELLYGLANCRTAADIFSRVTDIFFELGHNNKDLAFNSLS